MATTFTENVADVARGRKTAWWTLIAALVLPIAVLIKIGAYESIVTAYGAIPPMVQVKRITGFAVLCIAVFHLTVWLCRSRSNEKSIRTLDYIYLLLAFVGVFGILDVQNKLTEEIINREYPALAEDVLALNKCQADIDQNHCKLDDLVVKALHRGKYNDDEIGLLLRLHKIAIERNNAVGNEEFWAALLNMYSSLYEYEKLLPHPSDYYYYQDKMFPYYLLCISLMLRLTKVTAELLQWFVPKSAQSKLLSNSTQDTHNDGNRKPSESDLQEGSNAAGGQAVSKGS